MAKRNEPNKNEETKKLVQYINANNLWNCDINFSLFISQGAEQRVFLHNTTKVLKLNDSIYYALWIDYFNNLLLNNYFFPDTAYKLLGFYKSDSNIIYELVKQKMMEELGSPVTDYSKLNIESLNFKNIPEFFLDDFADLK